MSLLLNIAVFVNIIAIIALVIGLIFNSNKNINPDKKANIGYFICFSMGIYLILLSIIVFLGLLNHNYFYLIFILFIVLPFVIGYYSNYTKVKLYTFYQIISYFGSLLGLIFILVHQIL